LSQYDFIYFSKQDNLKRMLEIFEWKFEDTWVQKTYARGKTIKHKRNLKLKYHNKIKKARIAMAKLTIDQALKQGVKAHKAGQMQKAGRLYSAIIKEQPKHPDANHNMGVLAVSVGKNELALPFFRTALEVNPSTAQFWHSYIDALIKLDKLTYAKAV